MNKNDLGNYIHNCESKRVEIEKFKSTLVEVFNDKDLKDIYSFYLNDWSIDKINDKVGKSFILYGWKGMDGKRGLNKLEGLLCSKADMTSFCMMKTNTIKETLEKMNLNDKICICHPRAVMQINCKIEYTEDFEFKIIPDERRLVCLFRHIRNALAHNMTYVFDNGYLLLEDKNEKIITARILIKRTTLLDWKEIVESGKNNQ